MSEKQPTQLNVETVVRAYVANRGVILDAARELGCNRATVRNYLRTEEGQERLAAYAAEVLDQYSVTAMRVVGEAAAIAFSDLPRILRDAATVEALALLEPHHRAAISEVQTDGEGNVVKLKLHPKLDALKLLAVYAEIAGIGAPRNEQGEVAGRGEIGGLHITGPGEATTTDEPRVIPRPERLE